MSNEKNKLSEPVVLAASVAYTNKEVGKLRQELVESLTPNTIQTVVEYVEGPIGPEGPVGPRGPQGESITGPQGIQGPQGERGEVGPPGKDGRDGIDGKDGRDGVDGKDGEQGIQGAMGPAGKDGIQGPPGVRGEQGIQGIPGDRGAPGATGPAGRDGIDGQAGPQGVAGKDGVAGPQGERGERGEKGDKGDKGDTGERGEKGDQGPAGKDGKDGDIQEVVKKFSVLEKSIQNDLKTYKSKINQTVSSGIGGGEGSGSYWLSDLGDTNKTSLKNATDGQVLTFDESSKKWIASDPTGGGGGTVDSVARTKATNAYTQANVATLLAQSAYDYANTISLIPGATGPQGIQGVAGTNGTNGLNGAVGATGATGPAGPAGANGTNGTNGTNGSNGAVGATGATGPAGANGTNGTNGTNGIDGAVGATGATGVTGATGPIDPTLSTNIAAANNFAQGAFNKANTAWGYLANNSFTAVLNTNGQFVLPNITTGGYTGGSLVAAGAFIMNANGNLWAMDTLGQFISPYSVKITTGGFAWPDGSLQNTAASPIAYTQAAFNKANTAITTSGGSITGQLNVTFTPATTTGGAVNISAANTRGGTGYADFITITNTSGGATNPNKYIRLTSGGVLEILNNNYSAPILTISDNGDFNVKNAISVNGKIAVNGPTFAAYQSSSQSVPTDVQTKITFTSVDYDTNGNYSNSRFTPTVEGYYQLSAAVRVDGGIGTGERMIVVYKNGSEFKRAYNSKGSAAVGDSWFQMEINCQVYANGTGDYFEIYAQHGAGGNRNLTAARAFTRFEGCMMRGA